MSKMNHIQMDGSSRVLVVAKEHMEAAALAFNDCLRRVKNDADAKPEEARRIASEYRRSVQTFLEEKHRVEDLLRKETGGTKDDVIDFDAARAEIERRLACLAAAGNSE